MTDISVTAVSDTSQPVDALSSRSPRQRIAANVASMVILAVGNIHTYFGAFMIMWMVSD